MCFKIECASRGLVGSKFIVFALFYFVSEGNFPRTSLRGLIFGGAIERSSFALPVWGAYFWRGLFSEFYGNFITDVRKGGDFLKSY